MTTTTPSWPSSAARALSAKGQLDGADWFTFGVLHVAAHAIEARLPTAWAKFKKARGL